MRVPPHPVRFVSLLGATAMIACLLPAALAGAGTRRSGSQAPETSSSRPSPASLAASSASAAHPGPENSLQFTVTGKQVWTDTGVDIHPGDTLKLLATGNVTFQTAASAGPAGFARTWADLLRQLPLNSAGRGALIGRIGNDDASFPFVVGPSLQLKATRAGRLFLGINEDSTESAEGSFRVRLELQRAPNSASSTAAAAEQPAAALEVARMPGLPANLLSRIPRRIADQQGHPGDMVNFLILGPEDRMKQAFSAAGWVQVDRGHADAVIHSLIATLSKEAYVEMPMSALYLFGRPQDFGMAHAAPISVVATRHHLRLWKAPFSVEGQTLWAGAATHDIGFERDARNGGVTHKIDADVDLERSFVAATLSATGMVSALSYLTPFDPLKQARTATGGSFHSDGRVLVLRLAQAQAAH